MVFEGDWEPPVDSTRTRGLVSEMLDVLGEVEALTVQPEPEPEHRERPPSMSMTRLTRAEGVSSG